MKTSKKILVLLLSLIIVLSLAFTMIGCDSDKDITVTIYDSDGSTVLSTKTINSKDVLSISGYSKTGHKFDGLYYDKEFTDKYDEAQSFNKDISFYAKFTANKYYITLVPYYTSEEVGLTSTSIEVTYGETLSLPTLTKTDDEFEGWTLDGNDFNATKYEIANSIRLKAKWRNYTFDDLGTNDSNFYEVTGCSYFKERESSTDEYTYVFIEDVDYTFNNVSISSSDSTIIDSNDSEGNSVLQTLKKGECTLTITYENNTTKTIDAKVVPNITTFGVGSDYSTVWVDRSTSTSTSYVDSSFQNTTLGNIVVGNKNAYIPDINVSTTNDQETIDDIDFIVNMSTQSGTTYTKGTDYTIASGLAIDFNDSIESNSVTVSIEPKYSLAAWNQDAIQFGITINSAYNVYNSAELRTYYANQDVNAINIMRNIEADLLDEYYVTDGNGDKVYSKDLDGNISYYHKNEFEYSPYMRIGTKGIEVNGNFFKVDASKLPYVNGHYGNGGFTNTEVADCYVSNVHYALFYFADMVTTNNVKTVYDDAELKINNLYITGNNTKPDNTVYDYYDKNGSVVEDGQAVLMMSGSISGIATMGGKMTLNNTSVVNTLIGLFIENSKCGQKINLTQTRVINSWCNSSYIYGGVVWLTLDECYFGNSGGASIHFDDVPFKNQYASNGTTEFIDTISIDKGTVFNNYSDGLSGWFVGYGQTNTATAIKSQLETGVASLSQNQLTILNDSKFNFILYEKSGTGKYEDWSKADENDTSYDYQQETALTTIGEIGYATLTANNLGLALNGDTTAQQALGAQIYGKTTGDCVRFEQGSNESKVIALLGLRTTA